MKAIKYLFIGALFAFVGAPAYAQDAQSVVDGISQVIKSKPADLENQVKAVVKKNKKNAEVLVGIGRAYLSVADTTNAIKYADMAVKANKKYAPAYLLKGDIEVAKDNGGAAATQYQQAIYFDPQNADAYYKYANIYRGTSPDQSAQILEELRAQRPDVAVDAMIGHIYYLSNRFQQSKEYYAKEDKSRLSASYLTEFAMAAYLTQDRQQSLDAALYGISREPRRAAFNRLAFYNYTDMGKTEEALSYADKLFNASDSAIISGYDYTYYGTALVQAKQYDQAIAMLEKAIDANKDNADLLNGNRKALAEAYAGKEDFAKAIEFYEAYLANAQDYTATDMAGLGAIYQQQAATLQGEAQKQAFLKADTVYAKLGEKFPANVDYANFMRARVNSNLDPETKEGLAKPYYEALAASLSAKTERDNVDNFRLIEAYRYLGYFYYAKNKKAESNVYWKKILELDPENEIAKQALGSK